MCAALVLSAVPAMAAMAATVTGLVTDGTGAPLADARVVLQSVATGQEMEAHTGADGRYEFTAPGAGTYLVIVVRAAFSEAARTITIDSDNQTVDVPVQLDLGSFASAVSVTAARAEREIKQIPLHVDWMGTARSSASTPSRPARPWPRRRLDRTIGTIGDPAGDLAAAGLGPAAVPEEDSLHVAADHHSAPDHALVHRIISYLPRPRRCGLRSMNTWPLLSNRG